MSFPSLQISINIIQWTPLITYKTYGYENKSLIIKIVWNGLDVSKYIIKNLVIRLTASLIRLKFRKKNGRE